jgi:Uncharacterised protein family, YAP/Alf4/glomulin
MVVFKRIRTDRPARFLTTFAAALLTNVTSAFQSIVESESLEILNGLVLEFITSSLDMSDQSTEKGKEIVTLLEGVITTYVPIYLGNQILFWSARYWEKSHPIPSSRIKSQDLINVDLEKGEDTLLVNHI